MAEAPSRERTRHTLDAILPADVARIAEDLGVRKAGMGAKAVRRQPPGCASPLSQA